MTWRDQQRIGKTVRGSSLSSQEPNSYHQPEDTIDLSRIPLVNAFSPQIILKPPGTVPCLLVPLVEQFRPFRRATPWDPLELTIVFIICHHSSDMMCFYLYKKCKKCDISDFTKLPLAETRDPKWRSWWVPDVSVHLFTSGLYLARWRKVTETTEIMPDLMIPIWSWASGSTHCQHWLSCCVLLTPPHASTFPPIQAATSPRLDSCDYSVVCFGLY